MSFTVNRESRRSDQQGVRKVGAITSGVARDERVSFNFRVRSDVEVRQWRGLGATATPVFQVRLRREPAGGVRQWQPLKNHRIEPAVQIGGGGKSRGKLGIDDRVDENGSLRGGDPEFFLRAYGITPARKKITK